jgi:8-oxo-dGTP diphosphatase
MTYPQFQYCPDCGAALQVIDNADRERRRCEGCQRTWYRNPTTGVAIILIEHGRLLLGRRTGGKYGGLWCIPCGHVEWDEDIRDAARREFLEETGLIVEPTSVYTVHSNFHDERQHTVGVWFLGRSTGGSLTPGDDLDKVEFVPLDGPLPELAFPTDRLVIEQLREDMANGRLLMYDNIGR